MQQPTKQAELHWLARRIYRGILADDGELILIVDQAGDDALLRELIASLHVVGATPIVDYNDFYSVAHVLALASPASLERFDHHRQVWWQQCHRLVLLTDSTEHLLETSSENWQRWNAARARLHAIEQARNLPTLVVAVPTERKAAELGIALAQLREIIERAQSATLPDLQREIEKLLFACESADKLIIRTGDHHELHLRRRNRLWVWDDGYVDPEDLTRGARVAHLPAGALVTTLEEDAAQGTLHLASLGVTLRIAQGQVAHVDAPAEARGTVADLFVAEGQTLPLSYLVLGANPALRKRTGWSLVDQHCWHTVTLGFGNNRHWGGKHDAPIYLDVPLEGASLLIDDQPIIST